MFDLLRFKPQALPLPEPAKFGFERFYFFDDVKNKLAEVDNLEAAAQLKNKKILVLLRDYAFDEGALKIIAEKKNVCFLIDISRLIRARGVSRAIALSKLRNFLRLCVKFGAFYSFASFAENENEIRTPDEIAHIASLLGLNRGQAEFAMKMLGQLL